MSGAIHRLLCNSNFIRILAICQIFVLIFTVPVFANTQNINTMVQRVNNFTLWTDYTNNINAYYGSNTATYIDTVNTASYNKLVKLYDAFRSQFYTSDILAWTYNPTTHSMGGQNNSPAAKVLEAIGYNTAYLASANDSINSAVNNIYYDLHYNVAKSSDISSQTTSIVNAVNNIPNSIGSILDTDDWITASSFLGVSDTYNGSYINISSTLNNQTYSDLYWHFANFNIPGQNFYKIVLPTRSSAQNRLNEYIEYIDITSSNGGIINADYVLDYDYASNRVIIYILNYVPFVQAYDFIVHVKYAYNFNIFSSITPTIQYIDYNSFGYLMKSNNLYLREILKKDSNITVNDSINSTDIDLDVSIGIADFEEVNTISNKLRTWLSTGVSVSALIAALDALDDSFFTLPNRSTIETINSQYTDFYD